MLNYHRVTIYNQPCANFLTSSDHRAMAGVVNGSSRGLPRAPQGSRATEVRIGV